MPFTVDSINSQYQVLILCFRNNFDYFISINIGKSTDKFIHIVEDISIPGESK